MYFPPLSPEVCAEIEVMADLFEQHPDYFDHPDCPYSEKMLTVFRRPSAAPVAEEAEEVDREIDLEQETRRIYNELSLAKDKFQADDHAERMSYFRTSTALLEKLITAQERAVNLRQISRFYSIVLEAMEEYLEPEQINELKTRLKDHLG